MILRTCDKCGKEMEPIYFPPYGNPITYCADPGAIEFRTQLIMSVTEPNGKLRPLDICDTCNQKILSFIFDPEPKTQIEVTKNG